MSRRPRIHVPQGTYYVFRPLDPDAMGSLQPDDYAFIENLLPATLRHTGIRLLGYCWMPDAMHFALRVSAAPLGNLMREFTGRFAQQVRRRTGNRGTYFRRRYQQMLINPDEYLADLIRYLHYVPVFAGLVRDAGDYQWSSHRAYLGAARHSWLDMKPLLHFMGGGEKGSLATRQLLAEAPRRSVSELFAPRRATMSDILGNPEFIASLSCRPHAHRSRWSLPEIAEYVARAHTVSISDLRSRSRRRELVIARARISWFATERRVASLNDVARFLNHSASCLTRAVARYQCRQPELFALGALSALAPWTPFSGQRNDPIGNGNHVIELSSQADVAQSSRTDSEIRAKDLSL